MRLTRRRAREVALQALFQIDVGGAEEAEAIERTIQMLELEAADCSFVKEIVSGVRGHLAHLDGVIARQSKDWRLERIANVDRNILRMALYEILYRDDVPDNVAVNEAIELAKTFGSEESGRFVNGILGKVVENPELFGPSDGCSS
ncbi:MAG: transcription antitermination factor NusB [Bacillota bacterium]